MAKADLSAKGGIYLIRNKVTKCVYVGSARDRIKKRWTRHRSRLNRGLHPNERLQADWTAQGPKDFEFRVLENCNPSKLIERETFWLAVFRDTMGCEVYNEVEPQEYGH